VNCKEALRPARETAKQERKGRRTTTTVGVHLSQRRRGTRAMLHHLRARKARRDRITENLDQTTKNPREDRAREQNSQGTQ